MTAGFSVAVPASVDEAGLEATLGSLHASATRVGAPFDLVIAVNGPDDGATEVEAVAGVRRFADASGMDLVQRDPAEGALSSPTPTPRIVLVRLAERSKVAAWNAVRGVVGTPIIVFADADVRVDETAMATLLGRLRDDDTLTIAAGREVATLTATDGVVARAAALPYRFDFSTVPGRFYALRSAGIAEPMPVHVLAEDAYLTVRVGPDAFVKDAQARVYLRPPTTWRDYLQQRVRCEIGKLQLTREFTTLRTRHGFGRYPWRAIAGAIAPREYPLVLVSLAVRLLARVRALWEVRHGFPTGWQVLPSTKAWAASETDAGPRGH